jgi:NADPH:quinone reductase-like Zn-dependent oxidoreductase
MFESMTAAIGRNRLRPVVDRTFDFHAVPEALRLMQSGGHFGKIAIAFP